MRSMTTDEQKIASELFESAPDAREGKTRLTVRFDVVALELYQGVKRRRRLTGATLLRYTEGPARTPTGGRYTRRALTVRTQDGKRWHGNVKNGTDVVRLRLAPKEEKEEDNG